MAYYDKFDNAAKVADIEKELQELYPDEPLEIKGYYLKDNLVKSVVTSFPLAGNGWKKMALENDGWKSVCKFKVMDHFEIEMQKKVE